MKHSSQEPSRRTAAALIIMQPGLAAAEPDQHLNPIEAIRTFDQVWEQVRDQYFDYARLAPVWEEARAELRPQAEQAETITELRSLLAGLLDRIGESHFAGLAGRHPARLEGRRHRRPRLQRHAHRFDSHQRG